MKKLMIALALVTACAQLGSATTVYATLTQVPFDNGRAGGNFTVFGAPFTDNIVLSWLDVAQDFACYGQNPPFLGFAFISVGGNGFPCAPVTSYTFGPAKTWGKCTGPDSLKVTFAGVEASGAPFKGTLNFKLSEYYGGYGRTAGCYGQINSGKLKLTY